MVEAPLYLQITRELHVKGLLEPSSAGQHGVVDTLVAPTVPPCGWDSPPDMEKGRLFIRGHLYEVKFR